MRLIEVDEGIWVKVIGFDGEAKFQDRLLHHGLYPGDLARILRVAPMNGPFLVEVSGRELAIGRDVARKILVERNE
ncbi:MAG: FeoA family protein [Chloroflexota bacterium]